MIITEDEQIQRNVSTFGGFIDFKEDEMDEEAS